MFMNIFQLPKAKYEQIINVETRLNQWSSFLKNPVQVNMHLNEEYPFEHGSIKVENDYLMDFQHGHFQFEDFNGCITDSSGFYVQFCSSDGLKRFFIGFRKIGDIYNLFAERVYEDNKYFIDCEDINILLAYLIKIFLPIHMVEMAGLKNKKVIKIQSNEERTFKESEGKYKPQPIILKNGIIYSREYADKRPYNRHTESWEVKGHYRRYKNGKIVFIKSFTKGSGKVNDKKYVDFI